MFRQWGDHIDKTLETYLLATYEEEPFPYEWSEQDLYEQVRKLIFQYEQGNLEMAQYLLIKDFPCPSNSFPYIGKTIYHLNFEPLFSYANFPNLISGITLPACFSNLYGMKFMQR